MFQYLWGYIYKSECQFSNINSFANYLKNKYTGINSKPLLIERSLELVHCFETAINTKEINNAIALEYFVAQDLKSILKSIDLYPLANNKPDFESDLNKFSNQFKSINIDIKKPYVAIVEKFPSPYDKFSWAAFAPDKEDENNYGIKPGIYFKDNVWKPFYSSLLLSHELIHTIIAEPNPFLLGRGLEEGFANLLGTLYLGYYCVDKIAAKNYIKYQYLRYDPDSYLIQWYVNFLRQAYFIYSNFGLDGVLECIKKGRKFIKEVETLVSTGNFNKLNLPKGNFDKELNIFFQEVILCTINTLNISPIAKYVSQFISVGDSIEDVSEKSKVNYAIVVNALDEIEKRTYLIVQSDGKIFNSDVDIAIRAKYLRYEI